MARRPRHRRPGGDRRTQAAVGIDADPVEFTAEALSDGVQGEFRQNSQDAVARGVFGSPSYIHAGELFFGQDRLDFLEEAIVGAG